MVTPLVGPACAPDAVGAAGPWWTSWGGKDDILAEWVAGDEFSYSKVTHTHTYTYSTYTSTNIKKYWMILVGQQILHSNKPTTVVSQVFTFHIQSSWAGVGAGEV